MPKKKTTLLSASAVRAAITPAATALILGAIVVAAVTGPSRLQTRVLRGHRPPGVTVRIDWPASGVPGQTWLPADIQAGLVALVQRAIDNDPAPFSTTALHAAADALGTTGWFEHLDAVERLGGGVIHVRGVWRTPAAVVRFGGLDQLVSENGVVLPPTYLPGESGQKVIFGVTAAAPAPGRVWAADQVRPALALLAMMKDRPWRTQVAGIDTAGYADKKHLEIVTTFGSRIAWGGAPGDAVPGEQPAFYKLRRLDVLADRFGQIDASERLVDVTGPLTLIDKRPAGEP
ncbi:MAG: hypothetical protein IT437_02250 [Phycisphaerales bacterium]|nr:hypothetical protein [Phycisphaerales bacterium]